MYYYHRAEGRRMECENLYHHAKLCNVCARLLEIHQMRRGVVLPIEALHRPTFCFWAPGDLGLKRKVSAVRTEQQSWNRSLCCKF